MPGKHPVGFRTAKGGLWPKYTVVLVDNLGRGTPPAPFATIGAALKSAKGIFRQEAKQFRWSHSYIYRCEIKNRGRRAGAKIEYILVKEFHLR